MLKLVEILDFTEVLKRDTECSECGSSVIFTMREFFDKTKQCPYCNHTIELTLENSKEYYCDD